MALSDPLLKTRQVAEALHVSGSTIKRWVDSGAMAASRTVGKHRLILLSEALSFARRQGLPVTGLEALSGASPVKYVVDCSAAATENLVERLVGALQRTEVAQAREIIRGVVAEPGALSFWRIS